MRAVWLLIFVSVFTIIQGDVIYFVEEVLDTIELFKKLSKDLERANNENLRYDILQIWAQVDKLSHDIGFDFQPRSELYVGDIGQCFYGALEVAQKVKFVIDQEEPRISDGVRAITNIAELLPQVVMDCTGADKVERKYRLYRAKYGGTKVDTDALE